MFCTAWGHSEVLTLQKEFQEAFGKLQWQILYVTLPAYELNKLILNHIHAQFYCYERKCSGCNKTYLSETAQESGENKAMNTSVYSLPHQLSKKTKMNHPKEDKYNIVDYREPLVFSSLPDYCWECHTWRTSEPSKQVTVMRMWLKFVQLHLNTYIPASFPSCRSLLMAYSVLKESTCKWIKPSNEQLHPKAIISKYMGE